MKVAVKLVEVVGLGYNRVECTVRLGKKDFEVLCRKMSDGIWKVEGSNNNFDREVENLKSLGLEIESLEEGHLDTLVEFMKTVAQQEVEKNQVEEDRKDAENQRQQMNLTAQINASTVYKGMKFEVGGSCMGKWVTFIHETDDKARVTVVWDNGKWVSDETYTRWYGTNRTKCGDKVSRKYLFNEDMKAHIQRYLNSKAEKNKAESAEACLEKWIEVNKAALEGQGWKVPFSWDKVKVLVREDGGDYTMKVYLGWKDGQAVVVRREEIKETTPNYPASYLIPVVAEKVV